MINENLIDSLRDKIEYNIASKKEWLADAEKSKELLDFIKILPELPEEPHRLSCSSAEIVFTFRYDKFLITQIRQVMLDNDFYVSYESKESSITNSFSNPRVDFTKDGEYKHLEFGFSFDDSASESTCKRKVIGEEMKMTKIYEWNCEEDVS